ncbi:hypothetical protein T11_1428 [Trichinella zimbabwensis]|uniref:Uncharacterized protein n=1 Tax=Trichinella zimbabwensis TaxID=268475 RepID=A0A0V1GSU8_9BILA|nr:hypothetical protein T11_1428 [Trichinella zimbabwensis]
MAMSCFSGILTLILRKRIVFLFLLPFLGIPTCICFLDLLKSRHSKSSLPENACKFLFIYDAFAYVALISMVVEVRGI